MSDKATKKSLKPEQLVRLQALAAMPEEAIDTADIPEVQDWSGAMRGGWLRPKKTAVTIRLDADPVAFFKAGGGRYQTRIVKSRPSVTPPLERRDPLELLRKLTY